MKRLRVYAQLVRLPNVFTALADVCLGALVTGALPGAWPAFLLLLLASACLYCGGMVWNDYFDIEQDRRERPFRPLPSGKVTRSEAALLGTGLLTVGVLCAALSGLHRDDAGSLTWYAAPLVLALLLVAAIFLYDGWLKRTVVGPVGMGVCRFLNVLLALSPAAQSSWPAGLYLALVVGLYIVGVTWFARTEARTSNQSQLLGAALVMLAGLALAVPLPVVLAETSWPRQTFFLFPYLLVGFGFLIGIPVYRAILQPTPKQVQGAVRRAVLGLIGLDAILATTSAGPLGLVPLVLLIPALFLGRWLYST